MRIAVTGVTGFVGHHLAHALLDRGHTVTGITRSATRARSSVPGAVELAEADVRDATAAARALAGCNVAFYLVHSMEGDTFDFEERDRAAARSFARACDEAGVRRIVFLGGLGDSAHVLSAHLRSRQEVGQILRSGGAAVTELRAGLIIGAGSASFTMLRQLVERLPVMVTPRWVSTRTQPIAIDDVVRYLVAAAEEQADNDLVYEIGGPEVMDYSTMMARFASWNGISRLMIPVPVLTPKLSSYWVDLVTDVPAALARPLIEGLRSEMIVRDGAASDRFGPPSVGFEEALRLAAGDGPAARQEAPMLWLRRMPGHLRGVAARRFWPPVLTDEQVRTSSASRDELWGSAVAIGGRRGYPVADRLWQLRGWVDRVLGGYGVNRNGPSGDDVAVGDRLDFWLVVELQPHERLRLRSLMKMPGTAELELSIRPAGAAHAVVQTARFRPANIFGRIYWWALYPAHVIIFGGMIRRLVKRAENPVPADLRRDVSTGTKRRLPAGAMEHSNHPR
jgi:uncharacterized protein YbjT (DUF2867 family)